MSPYLIQPVTTCQVSWKKSAPAFGVSTLVMKYSGRSDCKDRVLLQPTLPSTRISSFTSPLPFTDAAAIPLSAETAWQALFEKLDIQKGQKVLIQAAAGGVGVFAVQLAKFAGAHVVAVGSERNTAFLKSLGADEVFDYHQGYATLSGDFDAVLDSVVSAAQTIPLLKRGGRYVSLTIPASQELADQYGVTISNFLYNSNAAQLKEVVRLIGEGALRVIVDKTFHFEDIVAALQYQRAGHSRGKNVLIMEKPL